MVTTEQLEKVIVLYEKSCDAGGVYIVKNGVECNASDTFIYIDEDDVIYFEFVEEDVKDFNYNVEDIETLTFEDLGNMIMSVLKTRSGDKIYIYYL